MLMRAATVVQQLCKSCRTCFKFYCTFYFTCDRSFSGELLAQRCRTDDLLPSIPISCLPPFRMDPQSSEAEHPKWGFLISCFRPGGSWAPPVCWWSQCSGDDTMVVFFWGRVSQVSRCPKNLNREDFTLSETSKQPVILRTVSLVVCLVISISNKINKLTHLTS